MTYERFEDLSVWKAAIELAEKIYASTERLQFKGKYTLRDQINGVENCDPFIDFI